MIHSHNLLDGGVEDGKLGNESFIMIRTQGMEEVLRDTAALPPSTAFLVLDGTYKLCAYDTVLVVAVVVSASGEVHPICACICAAESTRILRLMKAAIDAVATIQFAGIFTDVKFAASAGKVFNTPHYWCHVHVKRCWLTKFAQLVTDARKRKIYFAMASVLLVTPDETVYHRRRAAFIKLLHNEQPRLLQYLWKEYFSFERQAKIAIALRPAMLREVTTTNHVESFFNGKDVHRTNWR